MPPIAAQTSYISSVSLRASLPGLRHRVRNFSTTPLSPLRESCERHNEAQPRKDESTEVEEGAMSRRLADMTERNLREGGRSAQKAVEEAGFDEELKNKLLEKIAGQNFKSEHASAFAQASMPSSAGQGTRAMAAGRAWSGTEAVEDAALRMLDDSYKRIRVPSKIPSLRGPAPPRKVDTGRPKNVASSGTRLANARDRSSIYSVMKDNTMSEKERDQYRKELKERFTPGARPMPTSLSGLANLANERIEDAIARGQFKNLPRGQKIERDYNMSSPFLDTTEYFMNKIIQKQDIVPPWIEKQQEVVSTATKFRSRLRSDWRRHAARSIASRGGSLESQLRLANQYAIAEAIDNPPASKKQEKINMVDNEGHMSEITLSGELKTVLEDAIGETLDTDPKLDETTGQELVSGILTEAPPAPSSSTADNIETVTTIAIEPMQDLPKEDLPTPSNTTNTTPQAPSSQTPESHPPAPHIAPFRDPKWEAVERSYHTLAITNLNNLTRSYNLMAPAVARKPYFSLSRELRTCYADVAPLLAGEVRQRALAPKLAAQTLGYRPASVLETFGAGESAKVHDERKPRYGFKQFWKDLFS